MITPETIIAGLIGAGALAAAVRLIQLRRGWASWVLAALSLASGAALHVTLFPPLLPIGGETLLVATAETPVATRPGASERLVALPEAPAIAGAERVPDLATALRRHGQVQSIRILGRGLAPRDRDSDAGLTTRFTPMAVPRGLTRLDPPADTPAGAVFMLGGKASGLEGGSAELLDPAGRRTDFRMIGAEGTFTLGGTARAAGLARFTLRLRGQDKAIVSDTPMPLSTLVAPEPLRMLLIGAPSPETKYLRRWAEDSGIALRSRLDAGSGVDLGDDTVRIDAATLRETDVVIIDDNALASLGAGGRSALSQAATGGLGIVIRMTAPASAGSRNVWRAMGLAVEGGGDTVPVALLPLAPDADALAVLRGPGSDDAPPDLNTIDDPAPELARWTIKVGSDFVPVVSDADGAVLSGWQQRGQGRVGLWSVADSFALVLSGQPDRYAQWWSETVSAVSRADSLFRPEIPPLVQVGERIAICGIATTARVVDPGKTETPLIIDPAAGARACAAYRASTEGVHAIMQPGSDGGEQSFSFLVLPEGALSTIRASETGSATARWAAEQSSMTTRPAQERRGPAWPWFLVWLVLSGALWFAERRMRAAPTP